MKVLQSRFLSSLDLDRTLKAAAYERIDYSGPGGGMGFIAGGISHEGLVDLHHGSATTFSIREQGGDSFDEKDFLGILSVELGREIQESGGEVIGTTISKIKEVHIEFTEGTITGRVRISPSRQGKYWTLAADGDECRTMGNPIR
jgi:hypothetical protein